MSEKKGLYGIWLVVLGIAILFGLYTTLKLFIQGHGLFNTNDVIIWSLPLGVYIFLALTSSGLTLLAGLPLVLNIKKYEPFAKRLVFLAIATLIGAFVAIGLELGSVGNMFWIFFSPNLSSPIWWLGLIYSVELVVLIVKFWRMHKGDWQSGFSNTLGVISFLLAIDSAVNDRLYFWHHRVTSHLLRSDDVDLQPCAGTAKRYSPVFAVQHDLSSSHR